MINVIINNDDLGLNYGFNEAISDCYTNGIATSTSIRTNGLAYKDAIRLIKGSLDGIGLGIHLNLTDGKTKTKYLQNKIGEYRRDFFGYYRDTKLHDKKLLSAIERDFNQQFDEVKKSGIALDHINSHNHIHMIPEIFEIAAKLAKKNGISYIRVANEPFHLTKWGTTDFRPLYNLNFGKFILLKHFSRANQRTAKKYGLKTSDAFYGILHTGQMNESTVKAAIGHAVSNNIKLVEVLLHPAHSSKRDKTFTSRFIADYTRKKERLIEANTLKDPSVKRFLDNKRVHLTSYAQL